MSILTSVILFSICLAALGIGRYLVYQGQVFSKKPSSHTKQVDTETPSTLVPIEPSPVKVLEETITLAIADGKLSEEEEITLRKQAILVGKDPDELIDQLKEDVFGDENTAAGESGEAGLTFEKFVLQQFNPRFFRLDHWSGDKFIAGRYTKTAMDPDIQITINTVEGRFPLAVECKWRSQRSGEYISFADDKQLQGYQQFSKKTGKPTFIALGLGGRPSEPEELYLIPVEDFKRGTQHHASLTHYRKRNPGQGFFFDVESTRLM